jgi:DNA mismatch endonuclease, patch repair protein
MPDILTPAERSIRMAAIRSRDTSPELTLRKALHALGLRYRINDRRLPGKPDIVLPRHRAVVFVHGCFWHRHEGCKIASKPKSNTVFWVDKFQKNVERDARSVRDLTTLGWRIFVIWECTLGSRRKVAEVAEALNRKICAEADEPP